MNRFIKHVLCEQAGQEEAPAGVAPGVTYTEDQVKQMIADAVAQEVSGLKANNEALLQEKKESLRKVAEIEQERQRTLQESLKNAGKMDEFEKTIRSQYVPVIEEKDLKIKAMAEMILGSRRDAEIGALAGDFIDPESKDLLLPLVKTEFNEDQTVVTKYVDFSGNVITTEREQFRKYLREHPAYSRLVRADLASGGGAAGVPRGRAAPSFNEMSESQRIELHKTNPAEFNRLLKLRNK